MGRSHGKPSVVLSCEVCGGPFTTFACYIDRKKTCSKECGRKLPSLRAVQRRGELPEGLPDVTPKSMVSTVAREVRTCAVCDGRFLIVPNYRRLTCSRACDSARRSESLSKPRSSHPKASLGAVDLTCKQCGKPFTERRSHLKGKRTGEYCSNPCRIAALNALPRKPREMAECRICGKPFPRPAAHGRPDADGKTRGFYCSRSCMWTDDDYRKRRAAKHSPTKLERWLFIVLDAEGVSYDKFATVGRYVPDAILTDYNVIIEVDGEVWHAKRVAYDQQRDADLAAAGYTVMHFTDREIVSLKRARRVIGAAVAEVRNGIAAYKPSPLYNLS